MKPLFFLIFFVLHQGAGAKPVTVQMDSEVKVRWEDFVVFAESCDRKMEPVPIEIEQASCKYNPFFSVATKGSPVTIKNSDSIKHNAFTLAPNSFDVGVQEAKASNKVTLNAAGVTKIQCRFHPKMSAQILVLKNNCFSLLKDGKADLLNITEGKNTVRLWSPHLKKVHLLDSSGGAMSFKIKKSDLNFIETAKGCPQNTPVDY